MLCRHEGCESDIVSCTFQLAVFLSLNKLFPFEIVSHLYSGKVDNLKLIYIVDVMRHNILAAKRENLSLGFLTRSDTNRPVQLQNMERSLKFQI